MDWYLSKGEKTMEKKNLDWGKLTFSYTPTDYRYVANWENGSWDDGELSTEPNVTMSECAGVLQYAQAVFEGLKAYTTKDGRIVTFRPDLNGERIERSAKRLVMPVFPKERFVDAVKKVVKANEAWVPPFGSGATLYLRPFLFGIGPVIGVAPAPSYQFRMFATPVGPYFPGGAVKPIRVKVSDYDRAAPVGTGDIKAGLNYAMSLRAIDEAHRQGFNENFYLDSKTRTNLEETGGANIICIKGNKFITPKSNTILPSVTRRSLEVVAKDYLGMEVEERVIPFTELKEMDEIGVCGTAAVIAPVGEINDHGDVIKVPTGMEKCGPVLKKLRDTLTGIQMCEIEAPEGWIVEIK
ncbi:MAG: branched-chain amino acid aminotransferase [Eubacterium sp.]